MNQNDITSSTLRQRWSVGIVVGLLVLVRLWIAAPAVFASEPPTDGDDAVEVDDAQEPPSLFEAEDKLLFGEYEEAADMFRFLLEQNKNDEDAALGLAKSLERVGQYDEAIKILEDFEARSGARAAHDRSAARRLILKARLFRIKGRYDETLAVLREAIKADDHSVEARFLLGDMQEMLGRRDEAIETYRWFEEQLVGLQELPRDANWLTYAGRGLLRYSIMTRTNIVDRTKHVLHNMLQPAYEIIDRSYWPARIVAADLLREKYNNEEEDGSVSDYQAALKINENLPEAWVGLGEVLLTNWQFEEVEEHADKALAINPNYPPAHRLLAKKLIVERRYEQAIEVTKRALAINPSDILALSIQAAAEACRYNDEGVQALKSQVDAINPNCAVYHEILGDALGGIRQYEASEKEYLKAIELDPTDANVRAELGMMYMQWGLEDKAEVALDGAWALDPFNKRTKFTLDLLESLREFATYETDHFLVRYDAKKDPGLGAYIGDYLEGIYEEVVGDYGCPPDVKTTIEMFPTQRSFAVRITGKPWIHTVGACTGSVIAMSSPRNDPNAFGTYNFARVLKHEFTHTVTLHCTENRIAHWFTEGLAVLQENAPRGFDWEKLLAEAARRDELFTLDSIDWGFMRPRKPTDRQMAYAQSEWMCEFIIERAGYDAISRMLDGYREGKVQREVLNDVMSMTPEAFDAEFREWARTQVKSWGFDLAPPGNVDELQAAFDADPENAELAGKLAAALYDAEEWEAAQAMSRKALELDENNQHGLEVKVRLLEMRVEGTRSDARRDEIYADMLPALEKLWELDPEGWLAPRLIGEIALHRKNHERAIEALTRLQRLCPQDPFSWRGLGGVYLTQGKDELALPQLTELARLDEHDKDVRVQIARIHQKHNRLREAAYWYREALYIDPFSEEIHVLLGDVALRLGETETALREYRMLTELDSSNATWFERAAFAAQKMGNKEDALKFARRAVDIDPESTAKSLLPAE